MATQVVLRFIVSPVSIRLRESRRTCGSMCASFCVIRTPSLCGKPSCIMQIASSLLPPLFHLLDLGRFLSSTDPTHFYADAQLPHDWFEDKSQARLRQVLLHKYYKLALQDRKKESASSSLKTSTRVGERKDGALRGSSLGCRFK